MSEKLTKLEAIKKRIEQLNKQADAIKQREKTAERDHSTRQKIIIGAWVIANNKQEVEQVKASLSRRQDRLAFGLEPLEPKKTPVNAENAVLSTDFM